MSRVLVTGGAGYIGGQITLQLLDKGHSVFVIDRTAPPDHLEHCGAKWMQADFADQLSLTAIKQFRPDFIIHCAASISVGESVLKPELYYDNNFVKTKTLCDYLIAENISARFIFSSTAATYGNPVIIPCQEVDPCEPTNPYGESKLMTEWSLKSYQRAYGFDYVIFRYFNVCGADSRARHGQNLGASHIIAKTLECIKNNETFVLNGDTFETEDGTCVRDYIHVEDLADAHILAMESLVPSGVYNLGNKQGFSNRMIVSTAEKVVGKQVSIEVGPARAGDPAMLSADADKFSQVSGWKPRFDLEQMISHAWAWYNR